MKIIDIDSIFEAAVCLREGGLVAFPTETVYGLGANALNPIAVARIFEAKKRPAFDPLIVHISDVSQINDLFAAPIDPLVFRLAKQFMPGPFSIVHPKSSLVPDLVTSGLDNVAIRMPSHPVALQLLRLAAVPVAAPSANLFGQLSPTSYKHVLKQQMDIDYLIAGDDAQHIVGIESTVVSVDNNTCTILRPGVVTEDDIRSAFPDIVVRLAAQNHKIESPGLLDSHYSPLKPLFFAPDDLNSLPQNSGLILHKENGYTNNAVRVVYTSKTENLLEVAAYLFSSLHEMEDDPQVSQIFITKVPEIGVGVSVMDRLNKATFQYK